jgi:hypothetical protein
MVFEEQTTVLKTSLQLAHHQREQNGQIRLSILPLAQDHQDPLNKISMGRD